MNSNNTHAIEGQMVSFQVDRDGSRSNRLNGMSPTFTGMKDLSDSGARDMNLSPEAAKRMVRQSQKQLPSASDANLLSMSAIKQNTEQLSKRHLNQLHDDSEVFSIASKTSSHSLSDSG